MSEHERGSDEVVRQALDALADDATVDWATLESQAGDDAEARGTLEALREIEGIAHAHAPVHASLPTVPFRWGSLEVIAHLARGAHGDVYRARDPRLDRDVALKLLRQDEWDEAAPQAITEGRRLARVRHANVVAVYGADRIDGQAGIWMELVEGVTLQEHLTDNGPMPLGEVLDVGTSVCAGLSAVHAAGLVHRDVKAQNVMRERGGRTLLMDLGAGADDADLRARLEGTPLYLAPEVLDGGPATVASDVYAVGVLLHLLATGRYPVVGETLDELRAQHQALRRTAGPRDRGQAGSRLPAGLARVIDRATAQVPADRYASAADMGRALGALRSGQGRRFARGLPLAAGFAVVVSAGLAMVASDRHGPPPDLVSAAADETRGVPLPPHAPGPLSADGRFVPFIDDRGDAYRFEIGTGRARPVVRADEATGRVTAVLLSRDASRVAYAWLRTDGKRELRSVGVDGDSPRILLPPQSAYVPTPLDWSADGRTLLCVLRHADGASDVVLVGGGLGASPRLLLSAPRGQVTGEVSGTLSEDGRVAAISVLAGWSADGLHLVDTRGGPARRIVDGARLPRFSSDERQLFFVRSHDKGAALWSLALVDGVPAGEPVLLVPQVGGVMDVRVSEDGILRRITSTVSAEVYTAPFDPLANEPRGTPVRVDPTEIGNHVGPAWSPDGRRLAYFTIRQTTPGLAPQRTLTVRDMTTGQVRRLSVPLVFLGGYTPRWTPDGRHVAVWGRDADERDAWGYFRVDSETGDTSMLVRVGINAPARAQFSPDGTAFLYTDPRRGIVSRDLASGDEEVVIPVEGEMWPSGFAVSPDGDALAFQRETGRDAEASTIEVQRRGHPPVVRVRASAPDWIRLHAWTADGAYLLYTKGSHDAPGGLWRIGADAGSAVELRVPVWESPNVISIHPDGRRIAWVERYLSPELWISRLPAR